MKNYLPLLALCWLFFQFGKGLADRTLFVFSGTIVVLLAIAILFGGKLAMWCIVGVGLFTSIGWPNIFSLALDRMGVYKSQVSSLLVMAVVGGAILPAILGTDRGCLESAGGVYCSAHCLRLRRVLRPQRLQSRTRQLHPRLKPWAIFVRLIWGFQFVENS